MEGKTTFAIIKPRAMASGNAGAIMHIICANGYKIKGLKMIKMTKEEAESFYSLHKGRDFFKSLIDFITSGPVIVMVLEKENAVADFRKLIGATDPKLAAPETIRAKFGTDMQMNAIHGSDSDENAKREIAVFFSKNDLF